MVSAANLTACEAFGLEAGKLCFSLVNDCKDEVDVVVRIALIIAIPLVLIGALFSFKGVGHLCLGFKLISEGSSASTQNFHALDDFVQESSFSVALKNPYRYYNRKWSIGMQFFRATKNLVIATLPLAIAYLLFVIPKLILKNVCSQEPLCQRMPALGAGICTETGDWLLEFIEQMIGQRSIGA